MGRTTTAAYLKTIYVPSSTDANDVGVLREHLVENRAGVFAICILVEAELDQVFERQRLACDRVLVVLLHIRHNVDDVEYGAIGSAYLHGVI